MLAVLSPVRRAASAVRAAHVAAITAVGVLIVGLMARAASADPNDGTVEAVTGDAPGDVLPEVQDRVFEWAPTIIILFAAIAIFGFSLVLLAVGVRKGLSKLTMLVKRS